MTARIVLLVTSPRLPDGLLTAAAWDLLRANPVYAGAETSQSDALALAGVQVTVIDPIPETLIEALAGNDTIVWLAGAAGDQEFARQLGLRLAREPSLAELELAYGSWDPPGARLLDAVAVMDRLASPGGDPWKLQQTHESLAQYLLEEAYEAYDAISAGDLESLREELGDVLLQVVLHARLAEDHPEHERWSIDDVAGGLVEKMVRRNPHVFADDSATTIDEITANWERIKREEKSRESVLDGIALSQPALALAAKILQRASRGGFALPPSSPAAAAPSAADVSAKPSPASVSAASVASVGSDFLASEAALGEALLQIVALAREAGLDAEAALRRAALAYAEQVRAAEREIVGPGE